MSLSAYHDVLIVGAGHAGAQAAALLRQQRFAGSVAIVGDEPDPPYERPPLSKDYMSGHKAFDRLLLRPAAFWGERDIALMTGRRVVAVDAAAHVATTAQGERLGYGSLIWAAGGTPRRLACPGGDAKGVHAIRRRGDVDAIMARIDAVERIVIIGGGYIGLEAAAVFTQLGKRVVLLEAVDRVLARVAGPELSHFYAAEHRARGVEIRTGVTVERVEERDGRATGVRLADGSLLPADLVIVGIGIVPEIAPLAAAGAVVGNGIEVDEHCRTSLADVYAIGDCAAHANRFAGGARIRLESVQNANDQAKTAVQHLLGQAAAGYDAVPWFWSNQYDLRLQTIGLSTGHDRVIVRGRPESRAFSVVYLKEGRVIALDCVNAVKDYAQGRAHVLAGSRLDPIGLADPAVALKDVAAAAADPG